MNSYRKILLIAAAASSALSAPAQIKPASVDEILERANEQRSKYAGQLSGLLSYETRYFEIFDKTGMAKQRRTIRSIFIIYELSKSSGRPAEFRNVVEVDGKPVDNAAARTEKFFEKITAAESEGQERKSLISESLRYDIQSFVNGATLNQTPVLEARIRPYFSYTLAGVENIDGHNVYIITFHQQRECPYIAVNEKIGHLGTSLSLVYDIGLKANVDFGERLSGRLLIDAKSFQLRKEERLLTISPAGADPLRVEEGVFSYQDSDFGILVPKSIVLTQYKINSKKRESAKNALIQIEYERFTKPDVHIKRSDVTTND